jgi:predicted ATPase
MLKSLTPKNFLSFGPHNPGIELGPLNVLIGPNGCGKSNLIEAVSFMRAAPRELREVTRRGGGTPEWIWKGKPRATASVDWVVNYPKVPIGLRHSIGFRATDQAFVENERIEDGEPHDVYYQYLNGFPVVRRAGSEVLRQLDRSTLEPDRSILAQFRDPELYPELAWLIHKYERIRIYREWAFGRNTVFRDPQRADARNDRLEEDFSNLGLFLNRLETRFPKAKRAILEKLKDLYSGITDFNVLVEGSTVQVFFHEGDFTIPATRLSDGTMRYLCLLAILCDPKPGPLICIEEPELGLHPDIIPKLADLLVEASSRTQLIVTTHSDILIDALTETPEAVIVCSKEYGQTQMERLSRENLSHWLEKYRLGQLWMSGEIGGTRW